MIVVAPFSVTQWDPSTTDEPADGPALSRVSLTKTFEGGFVGEGTGEGLFCGLADPAAGAGYLVNERLSGRLGDREGTFVIQHGGLMGAGTPPHTFGSVVPGSGTGGLRGIGGTVEIAQPDGQHTMTLDVAFADGP